MIAIGIMIVLFLGGVFNRKSKIVAVIISVYMWIFYSFNMYSGDSIAYEYVYRLINAGHIWGHFEIGFTMLMLICSKIGLTFSGFRIVLGTIYILAVNRIVKKYTDNVAMALAFFMLFPFIYFTSVLRAGIAGLIVTNSISYLHTDNKKGVILYIINILIAMMFHTSSVFFLIFVLARRKISQNSVIKIVVVTTLVSFLFRNSVFYNIAAVFTQRSKVLQWLNGDGNANSTLNTTGIIVEIVLLMIILLVVLKANKLEQQYCISEKKLQQSELIKSCNFYLLILIPFMVMSEVWIRIIWEVLLIDICMFANVIEDLHKKKTLKQSNFTITYLGIVVFILQIIIFIYMDKPYWGTENAAINMFYNNKILGMFPF